MVHMAQNRQTHELLIRSLAGWHKLCRLLMRQIEENKRESARNLNRLRCKHFSDARILLVEYIVQGLHFDVYLTLREILRQNDAELMVRSTLKVWVNLGVFSMECKACFTLIHFVSIVIQKLKFGAPMPLLHWEFICLPWLCTVRMQSLNCVDYICRI